MSLLEPSLSKDEESSSSSESHTLTINPKILSSKRVGDHFYQLVIESSSSGVEMAPDKVADARSPNMKPTAQVKPTEKPKIQRARKTFPSSSNSFKVPRHLGKETESDGGSKQIQQQIPPQVPILNTSPVVPYPLNDSIDKTLETSKLSLKRPLIRNENGDKPLLDPVQKKSLLNSMRHEYSSGHQSSTVIDLADSSSSDDKIQEKASKCISDYVGGPPTPAPTPNKEDLMSSSAEKDVEAAMAALHGEALEDDALIPNSSANIEIPVKENEATDVSASPKKKNRAVAKPSPKVNQKKPALASSQLSKAKGKTGPKPKSNRASRELDQLFVDEGALKIMRDMVQKGTNTRRSSIATTNQRSHNLRLASHPTPKAEKKVKDNNNREQSSQDDSMGDWKQVRLLFV